MFGSGPELPVLQKNSQKNSQKNCIKNAAKMLTRFPKNDGHVLEHLFLKSGVKKMFPIENRDIVAMKTYDTRTMAFDNCGDVDTLSLP